MLSIRAFIQLQIQRKLTKHRCVVVYDPLQLYGELVAELAGPADAPKAVVVAALPGPTGALLRAWETWANLGSSPPGLPLAVYVAVAAPKGPAAQRADPFWALAVASSAFGADEDNEQYAGLAQLHYPDHLAQLTELFAAPVPPVFAVLDNLGGGERWPLLSHYLPGRESRGELLRGLMLPSTDTETRLLAATDWLPEAQRLAEVALGVRLTETTLPTLRRKLWQLVLMGEFVLDLICPLPPALASVERATDQARDLVLRLAPELRQHPTEYLERAQQLAGQLNLPGYFGPNDDLGQRLTFGFEDLVLLGQVLACIRAGELPAAADKLRIQYHSVWRDQGASRWEVAAAGLALHQAVAAARAYLHAEPPANLVRLVLAYAGPLHAPDAAQRRFEAAVGAYQHSPEALPPAAGRDPAHPNLEEFIRDCRTLHAGLADDLQQRLLTAVEAQGWPVATLTSARELTSQLVQPVLQDGRRLAYFLVDALRYELAQELAGLLTEQGATVQTQPYCAQLPTSTPIGMSALLPHDGHWTLAAGSTGKVEPQAGQPLGAVPDAAARDSFWERRFGDRVRVFSQEQWLSMAAADVPATVSLLVVRSSDLDQAGEHGGLAGVEQFPRALRALRRAVLAAGAAGFREVVIATDHGFVLHPTPNDGTLVPEPPGEWPFKKPRSRLGRGLGDTSGTLRLESAQVSIPGPWPHFVVPRTLGSFTRGRTYAHEGVSLAEIVLPALRVQLPPADRAPQCTRLELRYAKAAVTTRQPMITAEAIASGKLYEESPPVEFRIVVLGPAGQPIGKLGTHSAVVDAASQLVRLPAGEVARLPIRLDEEFEGSFTVRASNPDTQVELFSLSLLTAYEV